MCDEQKRKKKQQQKKRTLCVSRFRDYFKFQNLGIKILLTTANLSTEMLTLPKLKKNMLMQKLTQKNKKMVYVPFFFGPLQMTASSGLLSKNPTDMTLKFSSTY